MLGSGEGSIYCGGCEDAMEAADDSAVVRTIARTLLPLELCSTEGRGCPRRLLVPAVLELARHEAEMQSDPDFQQAVVD